MHQPTHDIGGEPPPHQRIFGTRPTTMRQTFQPTQGFQSQSTTGPQGKKPPFQKRKRPFPSDTSSGAHPEEPSASKTLKIGTKQQSSTIYTFPLLTYYPVFTSNQGLPFICETVFDYIKAQNPKLDITIEQFKYVTCVAFWNRIGQLKRNLNYTNTEFIDIFELDIQASGIILPAIVAQYISSLGVVVLPSGTSVVPYVPAEVDLQWYWHPRTFWTRGHPGQRPPANYWCLDNTWITNWINHVTRGGKVDLGLRKIDNTVTEGQTMMVVSSLAQPGPAVVTAISPVKITRTEAELGAAYEFRSYRDYSDWPGSNAELLFGQFSAPPVYPRTVLTEACAKSTRLETTKK